MDYYRLPDPVPEGLLRSRERTTRIKSEVSYNSTANGLWSPSLLRVADRSRVVRVNSKAMELAEKVSH